MFNKNNHKQNVFGYILGVEVGSIWDNKLQIFEAGIHRNLFENIDSDNNGIYSLILEEESELYYDTGDEFYYTVSSGKKPSQRRRITLNSFHNFITTTIKHFIINCYNVEDDCAFGKSKFWKLGKPIRVIRSDKIQNISKFAPKHNYRYDGLYKVVEYFPEINSSGFYVWRFFLKRHDPCPLLLNEISKHLKCECFEIDEDLMFFINLDVKNIKLWKECKNYLESGRFEFVKKVKEIFSCVCCGDIVYLPITTNCGHNMCYDCYKQCLNTCPHCKMILKSNKLMEINYNLIEVLKLIFPGYEFNY